MLKGTIFFLVLAIISGLFGLGIIATTATGIARILFFIFLVLALASFLRHKKQGF